MLEGDFRCLRTRSQSQKLASGVTHFQRRGLPPKLPRFDFGCVGTPLASRGMRSREDTAKTRNLGSLWNPLEGLMEAGVGIEPASTALQAAA